jgi:alpha-ribazole phosphatase
MKLLLIRHTSVNIPQGICYGNLDVDVSATFAEEVLKVLEKLDMYSFEFVYSSPLQRCHKLAEKIAGKECTIKYDIRLKEMDFGAWEGVRWEEIYKSSKGQQWFGDYWNKTCPGGESYKDLYNRTTAFLEDMCGISTDEVIPVVTHGGPMRAILSKVLNTSPYIMFERKIDYGEMIELTIDGNMFEYSQKDRSTPF